MKVHDDEQQAKFATDGTTRTVKKVHAIIGFTHQPTEQFACPFCLGIRMLRSYFISTKKGIHQGMGKCPECENKFRFRTLTEITTATQYAEFAYPYSASGFWQKVPWNKWKDRLYRIGWTREFWHRYHELKGEDTAPDIIDELYEAQVKWAKERGLIDTT